MEMQTPAMPAVVVPDPADIAIAQTEARQRRRRRGLIAGGVLSLLVGYPLSIGIVLFLDQKGLLPSELVPIVRFIYFPIVYLVNNVPTVGHIFKCYLWSLGIDL